MAYLEVPVPADLAPDVQRLWYLEQPAEERYERIFPQPALHLIVNLSDHLRAETRNRAAPPAVMRAWAGIQKEPDAPIPLIAAAAGTSHHRLIDEFRTWCGVTPKTYADIVRFRQFIDTLPLQGPMPSWAELVATSGYYDQPHFIRVFRAFTGLSPTRYLDIVARYGPEYAAFVPLAELDGVPEFSTRPREP
jgi:AraC-like DNA-binding protein